MNSKVIGKFKLTVYDDGYPIRIIIEYKNIEITINHRELSDIEYVVKEAMKLSRNGLPERYKCEV
jgi:hypothetical protein